MTADHDFPWIMIQKNAGESIKIFLRKDRDGPYLDMRIWSPGDNGNEEETDQGLSLSMELLPSLVEALVWIEGTASPKAPSVRKPEKPQVRDRLP